jgi:hypothetical protein
MILGGDLDGTLAIQRLLHFDCPHDISASQCSKTQIHFVGLLPQAGGAVNCPPNIGF